MRKVWFTPYQLLIKLKLAANMARNLDELVDYLNHGIDDDEEENNILLTLMTLTC